MRYYMRVFGWLLLGMGTVLAVLGLLAMTGVMAVQIDFLGVNVDTSWERIVWVAGWLVAAVGGLALVLRGRRDPRPTPGP